MTEQEIQRVLVVAAHPDDADIGCGGTMAKWARQGKDLVYLICTRGDKGSSDPDMTGERLAEIRTHEQQAAAEIIGVKEVRFLDGRDGELLPTLELRKTIAEMVRYYRPDVIFTHDSTVHLYDHGNLNHPDHRVVGTTVLDVVYPISRDALHYPDQLARGLSPHEVHEVYLFMANQPNMAFDISDTIDLKVEALRRHASQFPDPERVDAWLRQRQRDVGAIHAMGYAENFRHVVTR
ncbi:MAG TPA: PIG-L deacetylase family protein [Chloroflexota bacterium]|nr:PIG-L deacetylase family protein [Chloroflexota bacterium]